MRRNVMLFVAACVALLGAAAWLLHGEPPPAAELAPAAPHEPPARMRFGRSLAQPTPVSPVPPVPLAAAAAPAAVPDAAEEAAGPARQAPPDLPRRFSEPEVHAAVAAALREADSRGADVVSVDCSEHPCIVYVENVSPYDSKQILKAPSLAAYRGESGFTACFPTIRSEGTGAGVCGYAYEPKIDSAEAHEAALKRFRYRAEQMRDATR